MSNHDGKFDDRRLALEKLLLTICNPKGENKQRIFNDALINVLFSRDYYTTHQWPPKYTIISINIKREREREREREKESERERERETCY